MDMKVISEEQMLCSCCMEEHVVKRVLAEDQLEFRGVPVSYMVDCYYCENDDSFYCSGDMMSANDIRLKDAYRKKTGLLTSDEISTIRKKYGTSQKDMCVLLGWGEKTITRYEGHQVQERAHDSILKKIDRDPEWFLELLERRKDEFTPSAYSRYFALAANLYEKEEDEYLRRAIEAKYMLYRDQSLAHGNRPLASCDRTAEYDSGVSSLERVTEVIQYFFDSSEVNLLYKVKLMKLLWYTDAVSFREHGRAVTGLVYQARSMGAVPIGHDFIIRLKGVNCEEVDMGDAVAYHFLPASGHTYQHLTEEDRKIMDYIIEKLGRMTKDEIVEFMHQEKAFRETAQGEIISFKYAKDLQI